MSKFQGINECHIINNTLPFRLDLCKKLLFEYVLFLLNAEQTCNSGELLPAYQMNCDIDIFKLHSCFFIIYSCTVSV